MWWEKIKLITSSVWTFLQPIIKVFLSSAGPILADAALSAVKAVASNMSGATDTEKRDEAFRLILDQLKQKGITLGSSMINTAIEIAVQKLKSA